MTRARARIFAALVVAGALCVWSARALAQEGGVPREIRVELDGAVPIVLAPEPSDEAGEGDVVSAPQANTPDAPDESLLQQALRAGLAEAVRQVARELRDPPLELASHPPVSDASALLAAARAQLLGALDTDADAGAEEAVEEDILEKLAGEPSDYALRYRVLEVIGERPRVLEPDALDEEREAPMDEVALQESDAESEAATDDFTSQDFDASDAPLETSTDNFAPQDFDAPDADSETSADEFASQDGEPFELTPQGGVPLEFEFALRLEVYLDGPRLAETLASAGLRTPRDPAEAPALRVVLAPAPSWGALQRFRTAALARGATEVTPEVFEATQVVLWLLAPEPRRLLAQLVAEPPPGLRVQPRADAPERLQFTLSPALPEGDAPDADAEAQPDARQDETSDALPDAPSETSDAPPSPSPHAPPQGAQQGAQPGVGD